jgi:basic membrane protein A
LKISTMTLALVVIAVLVIAGLVVYFNPFGASPASKEFKIAVISSSDPTDLSWTRTAYDAMNHMKTTYNLTVDLTTFANVADTPNIIRDYASRGYSLIWAHGAQYEQAVLSVAPDFPKVYFAVTAGFNTTPPANVITIDFQRYQGAYLLGALAAKLTTTGKVASIGGANYPVVIRDHNGFVYGAQSVNPSITVKTVYTGTWTDPATGKETANSLIQQGYDVIWAQSDLSNIGILDACERAHVKIMYTDSDPYPVDSDVLITSVMMGLPQAMDTVYHQILNGTFHGGHWAPGMVGGYVYLSPYHDSASSIPQATQDYISQLRSKILDGSLVVPINYNETV